MSYRYGDVSWKTGIAEGIAETALAEYGILKTPSNFLASNTRIDEKYGNIIAWGKVEGLPAFSKISLRDINSGVERDGYWMRGKSILDAQIVYDAAGSDYLVVGGLTVSNDLVFPAQDKLNRAVRSVPVIEVFKLDANGITPVSYNPVALVDGIVTDIGITGGNGKVNLQVGVRSSDAYGNRTEGITTLSLDKVLSAKMYEPLIGN